MDFKLYAAKFIPKINEAIKKIYDRKLNAVDNSFLKDYYSELKDYFLSGGKRIRPLLCIATYNAFTNGGDDKIFMASVGTEFLHNASLVHDDIIDKDDFRRGKPAFHYRFRQYHEKYDLKKMVAEDFGTNIGIIGGDSAFFMGLEAYFFNEFEKELNLRAIEYYQNAYIEISDGVLIEVDMVNQTDLTIEEYINMISLKTGALIQKSILIGANYAKVDEKNRKLLATYGMNLGIIFQIIDDILGTFGDEKILGKPTDGDIREGKKTCLLITALSNLSLEKKNRLIELIENPEMAEKDVDDVRGLFKEANAIENCRNLAKKYFEEAQSSLEELKANINPSEYEFFENLLKFVAERKF